MCCVNSGFFAQVDVEFVEITSGLRKSHAILDHTVLPNTCHLAAMNFPPLPHSKLVLDLATQEGCKAELIWNTVNDASGEYTKSGVGDILDFGKYYIFRPVKI